MVQDIINSIVEAETKANEIIIEAQNTAADKQIQAQITVDKLLADNRKAVKDLAAAQLAQADAVASKQAGEFVEEHRVEDVAFADKCALNMDKAVSVILESLK